MSDILKQRADKTQSDYLNFEDPIPAQVIYDLYELRIANSPEERNSVLEEATGEKSPSGKTIIDAANLYSGLAIQVNKTLREIIPDIAKAFSDLPGLSGHLSEKFADSLDRRISDVSTDVLNEVQGYTANQEK